MREQDKLLQKRKNGQLSVRYIFNDQNAGAKQYQLINQEIFKVILDTTLRYYFPNAETSYLASDRSPRGHFLYFDAVTPELNKYSATFDAFYSTRITIKRVYHLH